MVLPVKLKTSAIPPVRGCHLPSCRMSVNTYASFSFHSFLLPGPEACGCYSIVFEKRAPMYSKNSPFFPSSSQAVRGLFPCRPSFCVSIALPHKWWRFSSEIHVSCFPAQVVFPFPFSGKTGCCYCKCVFLKFFLRVPSFFFSASLSPF